MGHRLMWVYNLVAAVLLLSVIGTSRAVAADQNTSSSYVAGELVVKLRL